MKKAKDGGFEYHPTREALREYGKKPLALRLKWLYMGALLRKKCPARIVRIQDEFRRGER
ncbi:MAG: hypothetical protein HY894_07295 [Deltaproteobacteria bacterium]|nr:hypothetical protein [Deltaproteobacteria bacterium]